MNYRLFNCFVHTPLSNKKNGHILLIIFKLEQGKALSQGINIENNMSIVKDSLKMRI